jgi:hypothetical protein
MRTTIRVLELGETRPELQNAYSSRTEREYAAGSEGL